jgi:hypothetical protein
VRRKLKDDRNRGLRTTGATGAAVGSLGTNIGAQSTRGKSHYLSRSPQRKHRYKYHQAPKRKNRAKVGRQALSEIRHYQKVSDLLLRKLPFQRLWFREIIMGTHQGRDDDDMATILQSSATLTM